MENSSKEQIKQVVESKLLKSVLYVVAIFIIAMVIFYAGIDVGFRRASFGKNWSEHYNENFGMGRVGPATNGPMGPGMMGMMNTFPNAHGAVGKIIKLELPNIIVSDKNNTEKTVMISTDTRIQENRAEIRSSDLKLDDYVVIIGAPNTQGIIEAKFIRIIPAPDLLPQ